MYEGGDLFSTASPELGAGQGMLQAGSKMFPAYTMNEGGKGMKKLLLCCIIVFFIVPVINFASGSKEEVEEGRKLTKIGYSPLSTQLEYFQRVILGMQRKCDENLPVEKHFCGTRHELD